MTLSAVVDLNGVMTLCAGKFVSSVTQVFSWHCVYHKNM